MYGRTVKVSLPNSRVTIDVFVFCTPETPEEELVRRAINQLIEECKNAVCKV